MIFIEAKLFTAHLFDYLTDDEYRELQNFIIEKPDAGAIIQGTGGLRKLRWALGNKGKRGGMRIIYYWKISESNIYFMTLFSKNEMSDLSSKEKAALKEMLVKWGETL